MMQVIVVPDSSDLQSVVKWAWPIIITYLQIYLMIFRLEEVLNISLSWYVGEANGSKFLLKK